MKNIIATMSGFLVIAGLATGCAHSHSVNGPQEKAEIPAGFQVGIGGREIKEGDRLNVFNWARPKAS